MPPFVTAARSPNGGAPFPALPGGTNFSKQIQSSAKCCLFQKEIQKKLQCFQKKMSGHTLW
jgi:hypothetical protein